MCGIAGIVAADRLHADERARARAHARRHHPSRSGRAGTALRRAGGARPPPPEHRRPRRRASSRWRTRTAAIWVVFNGEIYNHAEIRPELEAHGHRYRTRSRHRDHRPRLRAVGRRLRRALPRHVRVRDLGRAAAAAAARARSAGHQAALLDARGDGRAALRIGDQGDPRERAGRRRGRTSARFRSCSARATLSGAETLFQRHPQAAARPPPGLRARRGRRRGSTGTCRPARPGPSSRGSPTRDAVDAVPRAARGVGPHCG